MVFADFVHPRPVFTGTGPDRRRPLHIENVGRHQTARTPSASSPGSGEFGAVRPSALAAFAHHHMLQNILFLAGGRPRGRCACVWRDGSSEYAEDVAGDFGLVGGGPVEGFESW